MSDKNWDWQREDEEFYGLTKGDIMFAWLLIATLTLGFVATTFGVA